MSHEIHETIADIAELARLRSELSGARQALAQAHNATEAERAARRNAEADLGWWHATVANYVTSATVEDRAILRDTLAEALTYPHAGTALLAELEVAKAEAAKAETQRRAWTQIGARASADNGALYLALERLLAFVTTGRVLPDDDRALIERALTADHPGRALLAELDAARAVVVQAQAWREAFEQLDGVYDAEQALVEAMRQYDKATKASNT